MYDKLIETNLLSELNYIEIQFISKLFTLNNPV